MSRATKKHTSSVREQYTRTVEEEVQEILTTQYFKVDQHGNEVPISGEEAQQFQRAGSKHVIEAPQSVYQPLTEYTKPPQQDFSQQQIDYYQSQTAQAAPTSSANQQQLDPACSQQQYLPQYQQNHYDSTTQHYVAEWTDPQGQVQETSAHWQPQVEQTTMTIEEQWQQYYSQQAAARPQGCNDPSSQQRADTQQQLQQSTIGANESAQPYIHEALSTEKPKPKSDTKSSFKMETPSSRTEMIDNDKARKEEIKRREKEAKELEKRLRKKKEEQKRINAKEKQEEKQRVAREKRQQEAEQKQAKEEARREKEQERREERKIQIEERKTLMEQRRAQEARMKKKEREQRQKLQEYEKGIKFEAPAGETMVTAKILKSVKITKNTGTYRREVLEQGEAAVAALDQKVQTLIATMGVCPAGFGWIPVDEGYLCAAGSHLIREEDIDVLLKTNGNHWPDIADVNCGALAMGCRHLVKPPNSVPKWVIAWRNYYDAKNGGSGTLGGALSLALGMGAGGLAGLAGGMGGVGGLAGVGGVSGLGGIGGLGGMNGLADGLAGASAVAGMSAFAGLGAIGGVGGIGVLAGVAGMAGTSAVGAMGAVGGLSGASGLGDIGGAGGLGGLGGIGGLGGAMEVLWEVL